MIRFHIAPPSSLLETRINGAAPGSLRSLRTFLQPSYKTTDSTLRVLDPGRFVGCCLHFDPSEPNNKGKEI